MNENHWKQFYKSGLGEKSPSSFALFVYDKLIRQDKSVQIYDLGCGNGRDTHYFNNLGLNVLGIDKNIENKDNLFYSQDINDFIKEIKVFNSDDIFYSRFVLHAMPFSEVERMINGIKRGVFVAECRAEGDKPTLFTDHERSFINPKRLKIALEDAGFTVVFSVVSKDLAIYKDENPLVMRIIAIK